MTSRIFSYFDKDAACVWGGDFTIRDERAFRSLPPSPSPPLRKSPLPKMHMASNFMRAHAALLLVQLNFSASHVILKLALTSGINQLVFCVYRDLIALAILAPTAFLKERRLRSCISIRQLLPYFILLGLTGIFGNQLLFTFGLSFTSPAFAAAVQPAIPVFTFFLAFAVGTEQIEWCRWNGIAKITGLVITVLGATIMSLYKGPSVIGAGLSTQQIILGTKSIEPVGQVVLDAFNWKVNMWHIGMACLIGNCLCMAAYLVLQAPLLVKFPADMSVTAISYFFGAGFMILTGIFTVKNSSDWILHNSAILSVIFAGVVQSAINYWLQTWANKILGPSMVALYAPLQPLFSSIFSRLVLGSSISLGSIFGGLLIIAGLYCVIWGKYESQYPRGHPIAETHPGNVHVKSSDISDPLLGDTLT